MVFMARRAQLRNRFYLFGLAFFIISCEKSRNFADVHDPELKKERGVYYLNSRLFSGVVYELYPNGDTLFSAQYQQGIKNGLTKKWWANGQLKFEGNFEKGTYQGSVSEWYEDGTPYAVSNYDQGKESGKQMAWKADGSLKANYQVIGDRKYGLTGVKNCSNVWDEE